MKNLFENYGKFPAVDILKMEEEASKILGWKCKVVLHKEPYVCKYCEELIEKFIVNKYRMCGKCYRKKYYEKKEEYFKQKNKERYEENPQAQKERVAKNNKKYEGYFLYKLFLKEELVYIGSTLNLYKRVRDHIYQEKKDFDSLTYIELSNINHGELRWLEHKLIRDFKPLYNIGENVSIKLTEERQKQLLNMEMNEEYREYDLKGTKKGKSA